MDKGYMEGQVNMPCSGNRAYLDGSYAVCGQLDSGEVALTQQDPVHNISAEFMDFLPHIPRGYFLREDFISCGNL